MTDRAGALLLVLTCCGCASAQLNENTLDIAAAYDQLITRQVAANLRKTASDPFGLPTFGRVTVQTAQTTNSVNPTFSFPLSQQITSLSQAATAASGATSTVSRTAQTAGQGLSLGLTDQWNQSYTITPVTDPDQLRRLRVLFQYATRKLPVPVPKGGTPEESRPSFAATYNRASGLLFEIYYPIIEASSAAAAGAGTSLTVSLNGKAVTVQQQPAQQAAPRDRYIRRTFSYDLSDPEQPKVNGVTWAEVKPDITFVQPPGCVMCDYGNTLASNEAKALFPNDQADKAKPATYHKLEKNRDLTDTWLLDPGAEPAGGAFALPYGGPNRLYAKDESEGLKYFYEFVLFCVEASSQGTGSPSSGGQSDGRKTAAPQTISAPAGGFVVSP